MSGSAHFMMKLDKASYRVGVGDAVGVLIEAGYPDMARLVIDKTEIETGRPRPDLLGLLEELGYLHTDSDRE